MIPYRRLNGYENIDANIFVSKLRLLKNNDFKLVREQNRLDDITYYFSQRTINVVVSYIMVQYNV